MKPSVLNEVTGEYEATRSLAENDIIHQATMIVSERSERLSNPEDVRTFLKLNLSQLEHGEFACLFLDNQHRVLSFSWLLLVGWLWLS